MLLLSSKSLLAQNDTIPVNNIKDSLVTIPLSYIKEANIKLAEGKFYKDLSAQQDNMIFDLKELAELQNEEITKLRVDVYKLDEDIKNYENLNYSLDKKLHSSKVCNYIFGSAAITSTIIAIVSILKK